MMEFLSSMTPAQSHLVESFCDDASLQVLPFGSFPIGEGLEIVCRRRPRSSPVVWVYRVGYDLPVGRFVRRSLSSPWFFHSFTPSLSF